MCDDKAAELAEASRARDDALKVAGTIKHVEVDIQAKLDDLDAATEENEGKVAHWGAELEKLRKEQEAPPPNPARRSPPRSSHPGTARGVHHRRAARRSGGARG